MKFLETKKIHTTYCLLIIVVFNTHAQYTCPLLSAKRSFDIELGGGSPVLSLQYKRYYHLNVKSFVTPYFALGTVFGDFRLSTTTGFLFYRQLPKRVKNPCKPAPNNTNKVWHWHIGCGMTYILGKRINSEENIALPFGQFGIGYLVGLPTGSYMLKLSATPIYDIEGKILIPWLGVSLTLFDLYKDKR